MIFFEAHCYYLILILLQIFTNHVLAEDECGPEQADQCACKQIESTALKDYRDCLNFGDKYDRSGFKSGLEFVCHSKSFSLRDHSRNWVYTRFLPDSFEMLSSSCLKDNPWHDFPFSGFVAMLSALVTLMVDSLATSVYSKKPNQEAGVHGDLEAAPPGNFGHGHHHGTMNFNDVVDSKKLLRYRVIAMVLELGIIVHSVVIGLSLGASNYTCKIKRLIASLCFHQLFEGVRLGGCILQAEFNSLKKDVMSLFFSVTTPFGIGISSIYREISPVALITEGLLNASSAGLLIYMALVDI